MDKLRQIINTLYKLPQAIEDGFFIALQTQTLLLEERNRDHLFVGERDDQTQITPPYRPYTKKVKAQNGQPFDRVTLRDTGSFYRSIRYKVEDKTLRAYSLDPKYKPLDGKYSTSQGKILGISKDTKNELLRFSPLLKFTLLESRKKLNM